MSVEKPQSGPWGRRLWNVVAILTAIGLIGPVTFLLKLWPAVQQENASHCGAPPGFVYEFVIITLIALAVLWLYGSGVGNDIQTALTTPPPAYPLAVPQGPMPGCAARPGSL